jgi:AraC-like DNA-binding protein
MHVKFSTDRLPEQDRLSAWRDYHAEHVFSVTPVTGEQSFRGETSGHAFGAFLLLEIEAGLYRIRRTAADVARDRTDSIFVHRFRRPMTWQASPGNATVALKHEAGDFCVSWSAWAFDAEARDGASYEVLVIPFAAISPHLVGGRVRRPFRLAAASPLGRLLSASFDAANAQAALLPDKLGEAVLRNLSGLVAVACQACEDDEDNGARAEQLAKVKRYIEEQLAAPDLTPEKAAAAMGMSLRQLHRLFQPTGASFTRYVLRQRLIRCREAIAGATGTGRSVVDIAFGWGFNSMATFYRAFAKEFGAAPAALRASARSDEGEGAVEAV